MSIERETVMRRHEILETDVWVRQDHYIDHQGRLFDGSYKIDDEYDLYHFNDTEYLTTARSFADTPTEASFGGLEFKRERRFLEESDFQLPIFKTAIEYLILIGKPDITWLDRSRGGYSLVPKFA